MSSSNDIWIDAIILTITLSAIPLLLCMVVGLISSVFQAATQIQEQNLSFVPKFIAVVGLIWILGPWIGREVIEFSKSAFSVSQHDSFTH